MKKYDVAAFVWPSYTGDELRTRIFWPEGYGEWETVKAATSRYEGHKWPRKPLWGYVNEADPYVMEMQIEAAVETKELGEGEKIKSGDTANIDYVGKKDGEVWTEDEVKEFKYIYKFNYSHILWCTEFFFVIFCNCSLQRKN